MNFIIVNMLINCFIKNKKIIILIFSCFFNLNLQTKIENKIFFETLANSFLFAFIYEIFGAKIKIDSLKHKFENIPLKEELNNTIKDIYMNCLLNPVSNFMFDEIFNKYFSKNIKAENLLDIKIDSLNLFSKSMKFFSKILENGKSTYIFSTKKLKNINKKIIVFCILYSYLNAKINSVINDKIDKKSKEINNGKEKNIRKVLYKSGWYLVKNLVVTKFFNFITTLSALLASKDIDDIEKNILDSEETNKNMYNFFEILINGNAAFFV